MSGERFLERLTCSRSICTSLPTSDWSAEGASVVEVFARFMGGADRCKDAVKIMADLVDDEIRDAANEDGAVVVDELAGCLPISVSCESFNRMLGAIFQDEAYIPGLVKPGAKASVNTMQLMASALAFVESTLIFSAAAVSWVKYIGKMNKQVQQVNTRDFSLMAAIVVDFRDRVDSRWATVRSSVIAAGLTNIAPSMPDMEAAMGHAAELMRHITGELKVCFGRLRYQGVGLGRPASPC